MIKKISLVFSIITCFIIGMEQPISSPNKKVTIINNVPSLKFQNAFSIISGKVNPKAINKLPADLKEYLAQLKEIVENYKKFKRSINIKEDPTLALFIAIQYGFVNIIPDLIALGAKINGVLQNRDGNVMSPLQFASGSYKLIQRNDGVIDFIRDHTFSQKAEVIDILLSLGADVNLANTGGSSGSGYGAGRSAIHFAVASGNIPMVKTLIEHGASVNSRQMETHYTPLHVAIRSLNIDQCGMINFLISEGADINAKEYTGESPLMLAVSFMIGERLERVVECLLKHNPDTALVNLQGFSALDIARSMGNEREFKNILESHQAQKIRAKKQLLKKTEGL